MQRRDKIDAQSDERFELKVATIRDRNPYVEFEVSEVTSKIFEIVAGIRWVKSKQSILSSSETSRGRNTPRI